MSYFETYNKMRKLGRIQKGRGYNRSARPERERETHDSSWSGLECVQCGSTALVPTECMSCGGTIISEDVAGFDLSALMPRHETRGAWKRPVVAGAAAMLALAILVLSICANTTYPFIVPEKTAELALLGGTFLLPLLGLLYKLFAPKRESVPLRLDECRTKIDTRPISELAEGVVSLQGRVRVIESVPGEPDLAYVIGPNGPLTGPFVIEDDTGSISIGSEVVLIGDEDSDGLRVLRSGDYVEVVGIAVRSSKSPGQTSSGYRNNQAGLELISRANAPIRARVVQPDGPRVRVAAESESESESEAEAEVEAGRLVPGRQAPTMEA